MDDCDVTNYTISVEASFRFAFDSIGVVGSVFLLVIMRKTMTLKGFSGLLLFNEQVCCLLEQFLSIFLNVIIPYQNSNANTIILSCIQTVKNVSLLLLLAINCSLYTAICRGLSFRRIWTWTRIVIVIVVCWVTSVPLGMTPTFTSDYFVFDCDAMYPFPNEDAYWRLIIYLVFCGLALVANIVLLFKIVTRRAKVQPSRNLRAFIDTQKNIKLAMFVFAVSIMYTVTYFCMYTVWYSKIAMSHTNINVGVLFNIVVYVNKSFINLRLFFYLPLYRPMLQTVKSMLKRRKPQQAHSTDVSQVTFHQTDITDHIMKSSVYASLPKAQISFVARDACAAFGKVVSVQPSTSSNLNSDNPQPTTSRECHV